MTEHIEYLVNPGNYTPKMNVRRERLTLLIDRYRDSEISSDAIARMFLFNEGELP